MTNEEKIALTKSFIAKFTKIVSTADVADNCKVAFPRFNHCERKLIQFLSDAGYDHDAWIVSSHAANVPATYGAPLINTITRDAEFYCDKLKIVLEDLEEPLYTPAPKKAEPASKKESTHDRPIVVTGNYNKVLFGSTDSSTNVSIETTFSSVQHAVASLEDGDTRNKILEHLNALRQSIEDNDKPSAWEKYKSFVAVIADHMQLLGPFLPQLTALLPT
jgi:hypothetical protein